VNATILDRFRPARPETVEPHRRGRPEPIRTCRPRRSTAAPVLPGIAAGLALALALPCPAAAQAAPPAAEAPPPAAALEPVPEPSLGGLEPEVAEQLRLAREEMASILESAAPGAELAAVDPALLGAADRSRLAAALGELGRNYHAYALHDAAAAAYRDAARLDPRSYDWHYLLGAAEQAAGRLDAAAAAYGAALALAPDDLAARVRLAGVRRAQGRLEEAMALALRALADRPGAPAAHAEAGHAALALGRHREAADHLEAALAAVPAATLLHHPLGLAYRGLGDLEAATEHLALRGEVGLRPPEPLLDALEELKSGERVHTLRGRRAFRFGDFAAAAESFHQALAARPDSIGARINLAAALARLGDEEGAIAALRPAVAAAPDDPTVRYNLGSLLLAAGRTADAVEQLREAVELAPADAGAHLALADALRATGEPHESLVHYRKASEADPASASAWLRGAEILTALGRHAEAARVLDAAHAANPTDGPIAQDLARLLAASPDGSVRDGERAVELADRVVAARPTTWNAETLALALAEAGRCDDAAAVQEKAVTAYESADAPDALAAARALLARYREERPCRYPVAPTPEPESDPAPSAGGG